MGIQRFGWTWNEAETQRLLLAIKGLDLDSIEPVQQRGVGAIRWHGVYSEADQWIVDNDVPIRTTPLIVSRRGRDVVDEVYPGNLEYQRIPVRHRDTPWPTDYFVAHIQHRLDCIDSDQSLSHVGSDGVRNYYRFGFRPDVVPQDIGIFRAKFAHTRIFVRDRLKQVVTRAKLKGCLFAHP